MFRAGGFGVVVALDAATEHCTIVMQNGLVAGAPVNVISDAKECLHAFAEEAWL